jgi:hypothetical protein
MSESTKQAAEAKPGESPSKAETAKSSAPETAAAAEIRPEVAKQTRRASLPYAQAAALAAAVGFGWLGGWASFAAPRQPGDPLTNQMQRIDLIGLAAGVEKTEIETKRMAAEMQILGADLQPLKEAFERSNQEAASWRAQLTERLDQAQRLEEDVSAKLASVMERAQQSDQVGAAKLASVIERLEKVERMDPRLAEVAERLERIERQMTTAATTASVVKPAAVVSNDVAERTGSVAEAKPAIVAGWVLRDVHAGVALVEGRNHRLVEIVPGQNLPGVGRIEAIERRGKSWVVVTSRGIITSLQW